MSQNTLTIDEARIIKLSLDVMYYAHMDDTKKLRSELEQIEGSYDRQLMRDRIEISERASRAFLLDADKIRAKLINLTEVK